MALHILAFIVFLCAPNLTGLFPSRPTKVTWLKLSKGTGENPSPYSYKKAKNLPDSTLREQKKSLKEIAKDKKGADEKSIKSPVKKTPVDSNKRTAQNAGVNPTPQTAQDKAIADALARVQSQMEQRQVDIEAAQIDKEGTGQSPEGTLNSENNVTDPELIAYYNAIKKKIQEQWIATPKTLTEGQVLKAEISLLINDQGNIVETTLATQSGDTSFDLSVMRAIERAAPFPIPPEGIRDEVLKEGFLFGFNPNSVVDSTASR